MGGLGEAPGKGKNGGGPACGFWVRSHGHRGKIEHVQAKGKDRENTVTLILSHESARTQTQAFITGWANCPKGDLTP